jgi:hypothetical protein
MPGYEWTPKLPVKTEQELDGYVTVGLAAKMLGVNASRIRQMINEGKLHPRALGDSTSSKRPFFMLDKDEINKLRDAEPKTKRGPKPGQGGRPKTN